ncbi:VanW family protein [Clostridium thailandense]|uniref:VanW family protein n=1 Tax=Clostridium thailandense TaxID=2794346 RepID=UPI003989B929
MSRKIISTLVLSIFLFTACKTSKNVPEQGSMEKIIPKQETTEKSIPKQSEVKPSEPNKNQQQSQKNSDSKAQVQKPAPKKEPIKKQTNENKILASFNTNILDSDPNRVNNIRLAAKKINSFTLKPGEIFSFNEVVGKRETKTGYKSAKILVNGETSEDVGGGICQLSSTIYNTALKLNMEIIERHEHSGDVSYIPDGKDAAVSYGYKDLKFKNNKDYSVKFLVSVKSGKVYVSILKV